MASSYAW